MTGLPLTLRRWTRHEYERLVDLGLTPPAAIAPLTMPSTPTLVAKLLS